jgi:hypothetical protein
VASPSPPQPRKQTFDRKASVLGSGRPDIVLYMCHTYRMTLQPDATYAHGSACHDVRVDVRTSRPTSLDTKTRYYILYRVMNSIRDFHKNRRLDRPSLRPLVFCPPPIPSPSCRPLPPLLTVGLLMLSLGIAASVQANPETTWYCVARLVDEGKVSVLLGTLLPTYCQAPNHTRLCLGAGPPAEGC